MTPRRRQSRSAGSGMRLHVRHDTDVPVSIRLGDVVQPGTEYLRNVSKGGLCFISRVPLEAQSSIQIEIPLVDPELVTEAVVVWCHAAEVGFEVGVRFAGADPQAGKEMAEQVCRVEDYKREIWIREGRRVNGEEAALLWLREHGQPLRSRND